MLNPMLPFSFLIQLISNALEIQVSKNVKNNARGT